MNQLWLEYRDVIFPVIFFSFGLLWLSLNLYIWECYKMSVYKRQIDQNGKVRVSRVEYPFFHPFVVFYLFASIPSAERFPQYYKSKLFREQVESVRLWRKIYRIAFPIYLLIIFPLIILLEEIYR